MGIDREFCNPERPNLFEVVAYDNSRRMPTALLEAFCRCGLVSSGSVAFVDLLSDREPVHSEMLEVCFVDVA